MPDLNAGCVFGQQPVQFIQQDIAARLADAQQPDNPLHRTGPFADLTRDGDTFVRRVKNYCHSR
eukprot:CAMPEP_0184461234 /NCGR_PEP_ID=MMETSP0740-20130409/43653_1 /TAXON_ID=385413 /ORGANISM="Thalassiosira miniscula, Strain CCMP1093" /LENGTH=63 /DNA_ID=CAMNT_0026834799 /DNA_START=404 /DNA_END=591 /DNA_ORIENTATION=+